MSTPNGFIDQAPQGQSGKRGPAAPAAAGTAVDAAARERERLLARRKLEAELAAEEQKIAEARKAIRDASMPQTSATPLEGKIDLDDKTPIEGEVLALEAINVIAEQVAMTLQRRLPGIQAYVVHAEEDASAMATLAMFDAQSAQIRDAFDVFSEAAQQVVDRPAPGHGPGPAGAPGGDVEPGDDVEPGAAFAPAGLGLTALTATTTALVDLVALFRTDVSLKGLDVAFDESVLVSKIASFLGPSTRLYHRRMYPLGLAEGTKWVVARLAELRSARGRAEAVAASVLTAPGVETTLTRLREQHDAFEQALFVASTSATPPLSAIIPAAALKLGLNAGARLLFLKLQSVRGGSRTERSLWRHKLSYSGGAIVSVMIVAPDGSIELADTISASTGFREMPTSTSSSAGSAHQQSVRVTAGPLFRPGAAPDGERLLASAANPGA